MPLTRFNVTDYSRHLIPVYPVFSAGLAISWIATPTHILNNSPVFKLLLDIAPGWVWGLGYLCVAYFLIHAVIIESRRLYVFGLSLFIILTLGWSGANFIAFFTSGANIAAWMWGALIAYEARVTRLSLKARESDSLLDPVDVGRS